MEDEASTAAARWSGTLAAIGHVATPYRVHAETPVQTALNPDEHGRVVLGPRFHDGLLGLDGFDAAWLLTWLGPPDGSAAAEPAMQQTPFLLSGTGRETGLFAMRGPRRPNPIGLHLVRVVELLEDGFVFAGVDMVDGTPVLDVKPWVARLDVPPGHAVTPQPRSGWFDAVDLDAPHTPSSLGAERLDRRVR